MGTSFKSVLTEQKQVNLVRIGKHFSQVANRNSTATNRVHMKH